MNKNKSPAEEWWTDDQKALVEDASSVWTRKAFEKVPGVWTNMEGGRILSKLSTDEEIPEGAVLDPTAWDHEHCALCWQTISEYPTHQKEGYTDGKNGYALSATISTLQEPTRSEFHESSRWNLSTKNMYQNMYQMKKHLPD